MENNEKKLEQKMIRYRDLLDIVVKDNNEPFVFLKQNDTPSGYAKIMSDMKNVLGDKMFVRISVYKKLKQAQQYLQNENPNLTLFVTYGYRTLEIQTENFLEELRKIKIFFKNPEDLYEEVNRFVAVPIIAGHPTGGAIDIVIKNKITNEIIDFGGKQYDYQTKNCYVFSSEINANAKRNRLLLRSVMLKAGFAPFDGEWWHFSFGDREWAYYYKKDCAIYEQRLYKDVKK